MEMALQQFDGMKLMPNLFLASVPVRVCIRICTVSLPLKQTASKVELLGHLPVQVIINIIILKREPLQAQLF
jgi:hypothetical protein